MLQRKKGQAAEMVACHTTMNKDIFFALHLYRLPECKQFIDSLNAGARLLKKHGYTPNKGAVFKSVYIQKARNELVSQFLNRDDGTFVFVADDLEFEPEALLKLIETPGDVVAGVYRVKQDTEYYPVSIESDDKGFPIVRDDGCILAKRVQTGFLKIKREVFDCLKMIYPKYHYYGIKDGKKVKPSFDFFPQGVFKHQWIGEDFAFCELWRGAGGQIWVIPDLDLTHYDGDTPYKGNYHKHLLEKAKK